MSVDQTVSAPLPADPLAPDLAAAPLTARRALRRSPLAQATIVVYAMLALSALLYPQALVAWLDEFEPNPVVDAAQGCAAGLLRVSETLGLAPLSGRLRERGKRLTHRAE